ncbi:hypothetical protein EVAR_11607_1 [Eumeta japonica]|uniref:Uncharacterized protein n=1 Tax=Eumeta variegata TaxID=151549 RepID=A0A4C1X7T7_EUMVA|nr:hypothetical protein EVAR_11607_1 [Eumeta japonica]
MPRSYDVEIFGLYLLFWEKGGVSVSVFLRAASRSVGLRACMSVCDAVQCTSSGESYTMYAFVPVICPGLPHRLHADPAYGFCA